MVCDVLLTVGVYINKIYIYILHPAVSDDVKKHHDATDLYTRKVKNWWMGLPFWGVLKKYIYMCVFSTYGR